jgi:hypothetical protein
MATFTENFTGTEDANLANGWASDAAFGGSSPLPVYKSNRGSTNNNTAIHVAWKLHGLTVSGDWQIDFDMTAPAIIGNGGVAVVLASNTTFQGWGVFLGNAVHVQKYNVGGTHSNLTNINRGHEGEAGTWPNHCTFTHRGSDGFMEVFLDSVSWANTTDNTQSAGNMCYFSIQDATSPTNEAWIDNLVVADAITGPPAAPTVTAVVPFRQRVIIVN